jgi:hypothetical protein
MVLSPHADIERSREQQSLNFYLFKLDISRKILFFPGEI